MASTDQQFRKTLNLEKLLVSDQRNYLDGLHKSVHPERICDVISRVLEEIHEELP
jgi:hypothetical protein